MAAPRPAATEVPIISELRFEAAEEDPIVNVPALNIDGVLVMVLRKPLLAVLAITVKILVLLADALAV